MNCWSQKIDGNWPLTGVGRISFLIGDYADGPPWTPATSCRSPMPARELHARLRVRKAPGDEKLRMPESTGLRGWSRAP